MRAFKTYTHYIHIEKSNDKPEKSETVFVYQRILYFVPIAGE